MFEKLIGIMKTPLLKVIRRGLLIFGELEEVLLPFFPIYSLQMLLDIIKGRLPKY